MDGPISIRLATEKDIQAILEVSEGLYGGMDYLPNEINQWFQSKAMYMFVAELQGKIIGFQGTSVIDGGQTIALTALRIHQKYRGRGYSYQIMAGAIDGVLGIKPSIPKVRYVVHNNLPMKRVSDKMGFKVIMERSVCYVKEVPRKNSVVFNTIVSRNHGELHELGLQDAVELILNQRKFDLVFPEKRVMASLIECYELMPENAEFVFKVGDKMFTDLNTEEIRRGLMPKSLSIGRKSNRVKYTNWICHIHTTDRDEFKFHLLRQMLAAIENLEQADKRTFQVLFPTNLDFDAGEIFKEVLCLEQDDSVIHDASAVLYEKDI